MSGGTSQKLASRRGRCGVADEAIAAVATVVAKARKWLGNKIMRGLAAAVRVA